MSVRISRVNGQAVILDDRSPLLEPLGLPIYPCLHDPYLFRVADRFYIRHGTEMCYVDGAWDSFPEFLELLDGYHTLSDVAERLPSISVTEMRAFLSQLKELEWLHEGPVVPLVREPVLSHASALRGKHVRVEAEGAMGEAIATLLLKVGATPVTDGGSAVDLMVAVRPFPDQHGLDQADRTALELAVPSVLAFLLGSSLVLVPRRPEGRPCFHCYTERRFNRAAAGDVERLLFTVPPVRSSQGARSHAFVSACAQELLNVLGLMLSSVTEGAVAAVTEYDLHSGARLERPCLALSECPVCGGAKGAQSPALETPKIAWIANEQLGIIQQWAANRMEPADPALLNLSCVMPRQADSALGGSDYSVVGAAGLDLDPTFVRAVGEGVEFYAASQVPRERLQVGTYLDLQSEAVDPKSLFLFAPGQETAPDFPFSPYTHDAALEWIEARSLVTGRPRLVPAQLVYHRFRPAPGLSMYTGPVSTGLAAGTSTEHAFVNALSELVERDAFMLAWLHRLEVPRVDPESVTAPDVRLLLSRVKQRGLQVTIGVTTLDIPIPSVVVILQDPSGSVPAASFGMAAHLDAEHAIRKALQEAIMMRTAVRRHLLISDPEEFTSDFNRVKLLREHALLYASPLMQEAYAFLRNGRIVPTAELQRPYPAQPGQQLDLILEMMTAQQLEPLGIDLTSADVRQAGFRVVRALVPNMQPVEGPHAGRPIGSPRLFSVPIKLGLTVSATLWPYPHPFS